MITLEVLVLILVVVDEVLVQVQDEE